MNTKTIAIIVAAAVLIGVVFALPVKPGDIKPAIIDETEIKDAAKLDSNIGGEDAPGVGDLSSLNMELDEGVTFYIDENGSKHYSLEARDAPAVKKP